MIVHLIGWAPRRGIGSPHRASQQASNARQCRALWPPPADHAFGPVMAQTDTPLDAASPRAGSGTTSTRIKTTSRFSLLRRRPFCIRAQKALPAGHPGGARQRSRSPPPENFAAFMRWQNFWTESAGRFSQSGKAALLQYPELDYNLKYSHYNGTVKEQLAMDRQKENEAIASLSARYGSLFLPWQTAARHATWQRHLQQLCPGSPGEHYPDLGRWPA